MPRIDPKGVLARIWSMDWNGATKLIEANGLHDEFDSELTASKVLRSLEMNRLGSERKSTSSVNTLMGPDDEVRRLGKWSLKHNQHKEEIQIEGSVPSCIDTVYIFYDEILLKAVNTDAKSSKENVFRFKLRKWLTRQPKIGSKLAITSGNALVPYRNKSDYFVFSDGTNSDRLRDRVHSGAIVSKKGMIHKAVTTDPEWRKAALQAYADTERYFRSTFDISIWAAHGTLLGLWRDGDFIPNDDDFDAIYISKETSTKGMVKERLEILKRMRADGWPVVIGDSGVIKVGEKKLLDLMPAYWEKGYLWAQAFTMLEIDKSDIEPLRTMEFEGFSLNIPKNPEAFLAAKYGPGWSKPDPAYMPKKPEGAREKLDQGRATETEIQLFS